MGHGEQFFVYSTFFTYLKTEIFIIGLLKSIEAYEKISIENVFIKLQ